MRRPALRYYGGKWRLAPWIISHFPPHVCYVEPFGGAGSVLLRKPVSYAEVLNDKDGDVVEFFRVLRERTEELVRVIELTPFSREELRLACEWAEDELERARRLYVRAWQARSGGGRIGGGWRLQRSNRRGTRIVDDWNGPARLWDVVARLKEVQIECGDFRDVIKRFDTEETLFYLDPPYLPELRCRQWRTEGYRCELTEGEHCELAELLGTIEGMAIISGYPSELYDELYAGWACVTTVGIVNTNGGAKRRVTEALWISPNAMRERMPLFELGRSGEAPVRMR